MLSEPTASYSPLIRSLLKPEIIQQCLLVILLDWNEPWSWIRQLRDWIALLQSITKSLPGDAEEAMEQTMKEWQEKRRGAASSDATAGARTETNVTLPLSQGEWDEPLGLPVCIVCHNVCEVPNTKSERFMMLNTHLAVGQDHYLRH